MNWMNKLRERVNNESFEEEVIGKHCPGEFFDNVPLFNCTDLTCEECWHQECKGEKE